MTVDRETYLGDGLYASLDCGMVKLRAPRFGGDHEVYMEAHVLIEFARFLHDHKITLPTFTETGDGIRR